VFAVAFLAVYALRQLGGGGRDKAGTFRPEPYTLPEKPPLDPAETASLERLSEEYARLTAAVVPSVVSIDTIGVRTQRVMDYWGRLRLQQYPTQGQGSGVIVTNEGHVVTNHHVIAGQQEIKVTLHNGKVYPASLIGEDSLLDIAVLRIEGKENFVPLKLGDSAAVSVGQLVWAVGNPFGLGETVTQGIISAKERSLSDNQRDLFQTDAAINPGNSGGPLVNARGEIVGINVAIYSKDRENPGFQGVGFSIPSNEVKEALAQILERGRPIRGFLGVEMRDLNSAVRSALQYEGVMGAVVLETVPGSPAELAGLQPWDVLVKYDGEPVKSVSQAISLMQRSRVGAVVTLEVWRRGETLELKATIAEGGPAQAGAATESKGQANGHVLRVIGIKARDLSLAEILRNFRGALVTDVGPDSLADGIVRPGDLVMEVNGVPINNANELFIHLAASAAVRETTPKVARGGRALRLTLPMVPGSR
jgi:S1-C subfamily serine protease